MMGRKAEKRKCLDTDKDLDIKKVKTGAVGSQNIVKSTEQQDRNSEQGDSGCDGCKKVKVMDIKTEAVTAKIKKSKIRTKSDKDVDTKHSKEEVKTLPETKHKKDKHKNKIGTDEIFDMKKDKSLKDDRDQNSQSGEVKETSDSINMQDSNMSGKKKKNKKRKKKTEKTLVENSENETVLKEKEKSAQELATAYLKQWKKSREEWKFQKVRQVWLLTHMYNHDMVSDKNFKILLSYLDGMKGMARQKTSSEAQSIIESDCEDTVKVDRARKIVQQLSTE